MYRGIPQPAYIDLDPAGSMHCGAGLETRTQIEKSILLDYPTDLKAFIESVDLVVPDLYDPYSNSGKKINLDCNNEIARRVRDINTRHSSDSRTAPIQNGKIELNETDLLRTIIAFVQGLSDSKDLLKDSVSNSSEMVAAATIICYQITKDIEASRINFTSTERQSLADFRLLHPLFCLNLDSNSAPHTRRNMLALHNILFKELPVLELCSHLKKAALTVGELYLKSSLARNSEPVDNSNPRKNVFLGLVLPSIDPLIDRSRFRLS